MIVHFILERTKFREDVGHLDVGINRLVEQGVYHAAYPLHDVSKLIIQI